MMALNAEAGTALVLVTHDMVLAQRCQRRVQMVAGELLTSGA
jgi:putative ABC transport system ATP-binding protein